MAAPDITYLLVDGENIDGTLGSILNRKPDPGQRPRWQQLLDFAQRTWQRPVRGLFFINATMRPLHAPFVQALIAIGYRPIPLSGRADEKVVDIGIQRTLAALRSREGNVLLASHDGDFVDHMAALSGDDRRIGVIAFTEYLSQSLRTVPDLEVFDLEADVDAFEVDLPRVRIIPLEQFDPARFL